jgi:hypothetical protein
MSTYTIRFAGEYKPDQVEALQQGHDKFVKHLAAEIEPNAQGSFGINQVEGTFSTHVTGTQVGDHLETVRSTFESAAADLAAIDPSVTGSFQYIDDEGVTSSGEFPPPAE